MRRVSSLTIFSVAIAVILTNFSHDVLARGWHRSAHRSPSPVYYSTSSYYVANYHGSLADAYTPYYYHGTLYRTSVPYVHRSQVAAVSHSAAYRPYRYASAGLYAPTYGAVGQTYYTGYAPHHYSYANYLPYAYYGQPYTYIGVSSAPVTTSAYYGTFSHAPGQCNCQ